MSSEVLGKSKARHRLSTAQGVCAPDPRAVQGSPAVTTAQSDNMPFPNVENLTSMLDTL